jgi:hypothetical protein
MTALEAPFERINGGVRLAVIPNVDAVGEFGVAFGRWSWRGGRVGTWKKRNIEPLLAMSIKPGRPSIAGGTRDYTDHRREAI